MKLKIDVLSKKYDKKGFDCGDNELNYYLTVTARQHLTKGLSKTFVLADKSNPTNIIAYMTLFVCEVMTDTIPYQWKKKYPRVIPAARLARLAVSVNQQRKGYGELLVIDAMQKTVQASENIGLAGLFVDAKHQQAKNYYQQFGFISLPDQLDNLFLPLSALKLLKLS